MKEKPNIIFVLTDDQGAWAVESDKNHDISLYDDYRSKIIIFPFFLYRGLIQLRYCGLLMNFCRFDYSTGVYCRYLYLNCLSAGCAGELLLSTNFNQVYDDNRWWISRYQTLEREV